MKKQTKQKKEKIIPAFNLQDCQFYGVKWDSPSLQVLQTVALGLLNLTELFKSQKIEIKNLLTLGDVNHNNNTTIQEEGEKT